MVFTADQGKTIRLSLRPSRVFANPLIDELLNNNPLVFVRWCIVGVNLIGSRDVDSRSNSHQVS